ncbi:holo-ACP synthase [Streptomyces marincola]|uniref:Holo-[acyl-carrier-protein] synthase n=1 Tax=Streptomyces marincola TaxID=2878388 RepID=A0A1W7CUN9_9ACTN|nr:holo-ACP synthase [Streptomyces marincola]ARQ68465.1 holo-[acyl-carrier-protein] synthase [Streptomyces marincola]
MWVGVDVLEQGELARLLGRPWFRRHVYAPEELAVADSFGQERAAEFLTGRFAAKEAVLKVLGTGIGRGVTWRQVAVLRAAGGAPAVHLSGAAALGAARLGIAEVRVSVAHKKGLVVAVALGVPTPSACPGPHLPGPAG